MNDCQTGERSSDPETLLYLARQGDTDALGRLLEMHRRYETQRRDAGQEINLDEAHNHSSVVACSLTACHSAPGSQPACPTNWQCAESFTILAEYPQWLWLSLVVKAEFAVEHALTAFLGTHQIFAAAQRVDLLNGAVDRAKIALAVVYADTSGRISPRSEDVWNDLLTLAEPHIRLAVRVAGVPRAFYEDCVQEVWLTLLMRLSRLDTDPQRGSLACCLRTLARRTAHRVVRREVRSASFGASLAVDCPCWRWASNSDPSQCEPFVQLAKQETEAAFADAIQSLETTVGHEAHLLVEHFLAKPCSFHCLASSLDTTVGYVRTLWQKTKTHLRTRLHSLQD